MSSEDFLKYMYQYNINDIVIDNDILTNGTESVNVKNFHFNMLFSNPEFTRDLTAYKMDSTLLINITKAIILALTKYDINVLEYQDINRDPKNIPSNIFLTELAQNHFHMNQAFTYLPPNIKNVVNILNDIIENPITPNDLAIQDAYYKILEDYELKQVGEGRSYVLRNGNINFDEEPNESNELGFVSITSIILIVVNLGIIIATYLFKH